MFPFSKSTFQGRAGRNVAGLKVQIADTISSAIMAVDRDFVVTYVNEAARTLFKTNEAAFRTIWPNFDADNIVGICINTFHKSPSHQGELPTDPAQLPMRTEITIGELRVLVLVNGAFDAKNNLVGGILEWRDVTAERLNSGIADAVGKSQAVVEFTMDGAVQSANENFLKATGYSLEEIRGQHHSMFVAPACRQSAEYRQFWEKRARGEFDAGQYKRIGKGGREVWFQASYNPIVDANGKVFKVVEVATDITQQKVRAADDQGRIEAISKAQAVVELALDGKILDANGNFLKVFGYTRDEVRGRQHAMFVEPACRQSAEYRQLWEKLGRGERDAGQYKCIAKDGAEIWLQASYNPVMDLNGKPFKIVKYATDITATVQASQALQDAVAQVQDVIEAAKNYDLTARVSLEGRHGEVLSLCASVNGLLDTMASVVMKIRTSAREVSSASEEISASTTDLSQRTEQQAASLEETSASMEEMAATVKKNAENAQQANQSAAGTRDVANRGGQVVASAVDAMARIEQSSRKIADIIGVIDEIARQTNLLALNAAVEAARAGDAGRGFAVVAAEVRSLAQRSSQAAKDIKDLITNSNNQVKDGVELVNKAGTALNEIVASIKKVADIVADIASASAEQATGIEQVNKALTQMDEVTQQNSALVEENAATAKTLEQQSRAMDDEVSVFLVDDAPAEAALATRYRSATVPARTSAAKPVARPIAKPAVVKATVPPKAPPSRTSAAARRAGNGADAGGPVARMQAALAAAVQDSEWKEF